MIIQNMFIQSKSRQRVVANSLARDAGVFREFGFVERTIRWQIEQRVDENKDRIVLREVGSFSQHAKFSQY